MKEDKLGSLSMELSVEILKLTKELRKQHETVISNQIGRSATSICANIAESKYAHSRADFIAKLELRSRKQMKQASGLKCFGEASIWMKQGIKCLIGTVQL